jgi:hypothetical protein
MAVGLTFDQIMAQVFNVRPKVNTRLETDLITVGFQPPLANILLQSSERSAE